MTEQLNRLPLYERRTMVRDVEGVDFSGRPQTRADCIDGPRPCPWVGCRHHLYVDVNRSGNLKINRPDLSAEQLDEMPETCSLDVADQGRQTLDAVRFLVNLTREGVRLIENQALARLSPRVRRLFAELAGDFFEHAEDEA